MWSFLEKLSSFHEVPSWEVPLLSSSLLLLALIPFGLSNGDEILPRAVDASVGPIALPVPVVFFRNKETSCYVSQSLSFFM